VSRRFHRFFGTISQLVIVAKDDTAFEAGEAMPDR
jgi:hypothetical protein